MATREPTGKVTPLRTSDKRSPLKPGQRLDLDDVLQALRADGLISDEDVARALQDVRGNSRQGQGKLDLHPLVVIANLKFNQAGATEKPLTLEFMTQWLADKSELPYLKIDPMKIDMAGVTQIVSQAYALRYRILPIAVDAESVTFATCEPYQSGWVRDLSHILRREVRRVVASPLDVNRFLMEFYGVSRSVRGAAEAKGASGDLRGIVNFEQLLELGSSGEIGADDRHVVHIVDWLLQYAFEQRASDIHLEPRREASNVRFRIDGVMHSVFQLPTPVMTAVTARIKILGRMDLTEKRRPQDGRIKTRAPSGREVELRLSTMPTAFGEKCVMRIFDPDIVVRSFDQLGFSRTEASMWTRMVERPHGIVLVTGPTGSGKTTTLYSTLKYLATPDINVCTVEDPIEMVSPEFNQMQVQPAVDLDFATGVRTLLRQDPDIIMVGEIRDLETAKMAVQASLTGHLVLSTLHTNDAPSALTRLLDLGVPHYLLQNTLTGIVAQRLVRTLCAHCKQEGEIDSTEWNTLTHPWNVRVPPRVFAPKGCLECRQTGFYGRTGIYEMLMISPGIRGLIQPNTDIAAVTRLAAKEGMRPLRISAAQQVAAGLTTIPEVHKVLPPIEEATE